MTSRRAAPGSPPHRLVLWNIDLTLVDVGQVTRAAYVEAFKAVTGRPLVQLPRMVDRTDSEIFFEALAQNRAPEARAPEPRGAADDLLAQFTAALAGAFGSRRGALSSQGRLLPGAREAVAAAGELPGVVQSVLTGSIEPNALAKLRAFGLESFFDTAIGGYGSGPYAKGAMLLNARHRAGEKYGAHFTEDSTVYVGDSTRDVEAARTGGARLVAVASGRSTEAELRAAGADVVLAGLTDATAVVATIDRLTAAVEA